MGESARIAAVQDVGRKIIEKEVRSLEAEAESGAVAVQVCLEGICVQLMISFPSENVMCDKSGHENSLLPVPATFLRHFLVKTGILMIVYSFLRGCAKSVQKN